jgi:hypothetical protein
MASSLTERDLEEPKGTISFSVRLTEKQRDLLSRAAEKRGWTLTSLLKNAALEKAVHILNTSAPNRIDFRGTAEEIARQVFTPRTGYTLDGDGEAVHVQFYERLEEFREDPPPNPVELAPWPPQPQFLQDLREAARYGGTEFLYLIIQASEEITTRNEPGLPDPIDPSSV